MCNPQIVRETEHAALRHGGRVNGNHAAGKRIKMLRTILDTRAVPVLYEIELTYYTAVTSVLYSPPPAGPGPHVSRRMEWKRTAAISV